jgi:hypothetical protein
MQRREFLGAAAAAALAAGHATTATAAAAGTRPHERIATEEGWISEAVLAANARFSQSNRSPMVIVRGRAPMADATARGHVVERSAEEAAVRRQRPARLQDFEHLRVATCRKMLHLHAAPYAAARRRS